MSVGQTCPAHLCCHAYEKMIQWIIFDFGGILICLSCVGSNCRTWCQYSWGCVVSKDRAGCTGGYDKLASCRWWGLPPVYAYLHAWYGCIRDMDGTDYYGDWSIKCAFPGAIDHIAGEIYNKYVRIVSQKRVSEETKSFAGTFKNKSADKEVIRKQLLY